MKIKLADNIKNLRKDTIRKIVLIIAIIVFACVWIFYECSKSEDVNDALTDVKIVDNEVKQVELYMYTVETLNPLIGTDENMVYINKLMYSSLFDFDENLTPVGDLAESYGFGGDTLTIKLKRATFSDGTQVDAEDVEFTVDAIKEIGKTSPYYTKASKIKSVSGSGTEVKIKFEDENDMSLSYLSFPIVASHKYDSARDFANAIKDYKPLGSGMYVCSSYEAGKEMLLDINDSYYGTKPESTVRINVVKKDSSLSKLVETSNITVLYDKSLMRKTSVTKKDIQIHDIIGNQVEFVGFNSNNSFLSNANVRKAIIYGIDSNDILEECYYGSAVSSDSIYYPEYLGTEKVKGYSFDVEKAAKLLKDEGLKDRNDDGIIDSEDGASFSVKILVDETNRERTDAAERIAESLSNLGIDATVDKKSTEAYMAALKSGNYDIYVGGMSTDESMDFRSLLKTGGENNYTGYSNTELDNKLDEFMSGKTPEEAATILDEIKKILKEDNYYYCIGYQTCGILESPVFQGEIKSTFSNPYRGIETWYCVYEKREADDNDVETPPSENGN